MADEKRVVRFPPILSVTGESMPEAWENACLKLASDGLAYQRRDKEDSGVQIEANMTIEVRNPDADPFAHMMGGTNAVDTALLDYYYEMMGAKDCWIKDFSDPKDTRWDYMYHERLGSYPREAGVPLDQLSFVVERLTKRPDSRRTNIITWFPPRDMAARHTPCLQRVWFTIMSPQGSEDWGMDMQYNFRSNNVVSASFGNMQGLYMVGCDIRDKVEKGLEKELPMRLVHNVNCFHANSHDYQKFVGMADRMKTGSLSERSMSRADVVDGLVYCRKEVEDAILAQTTQVFQELKSRGSAFQGDIALEAERVHAIGDRIFYLLDKYKPAK